MAAEAASRDFQRYYKDTYGMLRTEWRVLFHLGTYGAMTARRLCDLSHIHKTKVSRAVAALEKKRFICREKNEKDRRQENLFLTSAGRAAFKSLNAHAKKYDEDLVSDFSFEEKEALRKCLLKLAGT